MFGGDVMFCFFFCLDYDPPRWWKELVRKLQQNDPSSLKLIAHNPFPFKGPKYIRTAVYQFDFYDPQSGAGDDADGDADAKTEESADDTGELDGERTVWWETRFVSQF